MSWPIPQSRYGGKYLHIHSCRIGTGTVDVQEICPRPRIPWDSFPSWIEAAANTGVSHQFQEVCIFSSYAVNIFRQARAMMSFSSKAVH